jgi:hypothetical protein
MSNSHRISTDCDYWEPEQPLKMKHRRSGRLKGLSPQYTSQIQNRTYFTNIRQYVGKYPTICLQVFDYLVPSITYGTFPKTARPHCAVGNEFAVWRRDSDGTWVPIDVPTRFGDLGTQLNPMFLFLRKSGVGPEHHTSVRRFWRWQMALNLRLDVGTPTLDDRCNTPDPGRHQSRATCRGLLRLRFPPRSLSCQAFGP